MRPKTRATARKAATRKTYTAKAVDMGAPDSQMLIGTIADANAQQIPDTDLYWLLFKKHPWIRACARIIANAVAQEGFSVSQIEGDDSQPLDAQEDPRERQLRDFFRHAFTPRPFRSSLKATAIDLCIYGWAFWRKKRAGELLTNLERLDPRMIEPKLNDAKTAIESFKLRKNQLSNTGVVVEQAGSTPIPADEIVMFSLDEGGDAVLGAPSPLEALDLTTALDINIRKHRNSFFRNAGTTGNVLINKEANEEAIRAAEKALVAMKVGPSNAYKNLILSGDWDLKSLIQSGRQEVDFVKATEIARDEICAVYSVPPGKLMFSAGALGSSGKGEDDETFEQECVLPLEELIYETITQRILVDEFGIEDLELVPKRRNAMRFDRIAAAQTLVKCGGTGNEARGIIGLAASDKPGMDEPLFIGATGQGVISDEPVAPPSAQSPQSPNIVDPEEQDPDEVGPKAKKGFRTGGDDGPLVLKARRKDAHRAHHLKAVEDATPALASGLAKAHEAYAAAFWRAAGLKHKAGSDQNALSAQEVASISAAIETLEGTVYADVLYTEMHLILEAGWDAARRYLDLEASFDHVPAWAITELEKATASFGKLVNEREKTALRAVLAQALSDGANPAQTAGRISDTFAEGYHVIDDLGKVTRVIPTEQWSEMVARTELSRAQNAGAVALYTQAGVEKVEWVTTEGENVCPECAAADGEVVSLGDTFPSVDVDAPPAHPRCACGIVAADQDILDAAGAAA